MKSIGVIGLGVMGKNIALNFLDHKMEVVGYNRTKSVTEEFLQEAHGKFKPAYSLEELVKQLPSPRKILLMVSSGEATDSILKELSPKLNPGDFIFDGGNSYYKDTNRREKEMKALGFHYYGVGISGGAKGARFGPSIMIGGDQIASLEFMDLFQEIAAQFNGEACCDYLGPQGVGHYVKMVHNGIEYADMQLIVEAYLLLKKVGRFNNQKIAEIFESWNQGKSKSYLLEISSKILKEKDEKTGLSLVDFIKDKASQKGTGKWVSIESIEQEVNASLIISAYQSRVTSNDPRRIIVSQQLPDPKGRDIDSIVFAQEVKKAYYLGKVLAYTQGFDLMKDASEKYQWNLDLAKVASVFRSGCIIQSALVETIMGLYQKNKNLRSLMEEELILTEIKDKVQSLRVVTSMAVLQGVPTGCFQSALGFMEQLRNVHVGANLIQAQRDYFGSHRFERIDEEGEIHHEWEN